MGNAEWRNCWASPSPGDRGAADLWTAIKMACRIQLSLLLLLSVTVQCAHDNSTAGDVDIDARNNALLLILYGIVGFFAITATINGVGCYLDKKNGRNKVGDDGED